MHSVIYFFEVFEKSFKIFALCHKYRFFHFPFPLDFSATDEYIFVLLTTQDSIVIFFFPWRIDLS